ncbi:nucleolar GTP-binding protein [Chloropicon primus]|uniref:Nucleolar GTP-binding protein 1 n=2 Tax=Chloropicon primus TaxID=1764295 RepID=A0A5B8MPA1_9CHLO|nr:nucleolar GTP-binding protein [Chloropicon primus]UPR00382.1 nucleolar GTP-binding protein [Chloropicon primus]|eukprot:QDZ21170.1 nucleolar GTP-binding protein [Chloropicon primus]
MPVYNFKALPTVPSASDLLDVVLSKTQRQTPTVVRGKWQISRIRQFYMRKVKYTQQTFHDKLGKVLDSFPKLDDIHPFYSDLMNVLYDRDHYKLALGQIHTAVGLIDKIAKDYVRLLKYGDSLYRCKQLKKAALGRMCTLMKKQKASLVYLEQVRQHMSRLPSIDPNTRTLLVCGYPNVGKSSFMNTVTRADVEVEPYAFTTKSLYVGHMDFKYLRWQVIDTPGILDRPLETRNTIEMQSITALAHLRAVILYIVDISEQCGYTIAQQAALFHSIKPLFANKPLLVVCNKTDAQAMEDLPQKSKDLLEEMKKAADMNCAGLTASMVVDSSSADGGLVTMSTLKEDGVSDVKNKACEMLLMSRVDQKLKTRKTNDVLNRLHVALPSTGVRAPNIPKSVLANAKAGYPKSERKTEKDLQEENGGAGVYSMDVRKNYLLEKDEWKYDKIPEIFDGHNVADFVDPDIEERLAELEREEEAMLQEEENQMDEESEDDLTAEEKQTLKKIRAKKSKIIMDHRKKKQKGQGSAHIARKHDTERRLTSRRMRDELGEMGVDASAAIERNRGRSVTRRGKKRALEDDEDMEGRSKSRSKSRSAVLGRTHSSKSRSRSRGPSVAHSAEPGSGFKHSAQKMKAQILSDKMQRKMQKLARKGEGDRIIPNEMPKHLFSGKRGIGKTDRR